MENEKKPIKKTTKKHKFEFTKTEITCSTCGKKFIFFHDFPLLKKEKKCWACKNKKGRGK